MESMLPAMHMSARSTEDAIPSRTPTREQNPGRDPEPLKHPVCFQSTLDSK